ncbi:MAG: Tad domain-containing protein [Tabrizicola sp.]
MKDSAGIVSRMWRSRRAYQKSAILLPELLLNFPLGNSSFETGSLLLMDDHMLKKSDRRTVSALLFRKASDFRSDETGAMAIFTLFIFVMMIMFGGIAVDVMRFEWRRVSLQQTLDRAVLAASSMQQKTRTPQQITTEWFQVAGLGDELEVDYTPPTVTGTANANKRSATATAKVRSYNHFMGWMNVNYLESPVIAAAAEGIAKVEVILVLDITGSMNDPAAAGDTKTKIAALREAADSFVTIVKGADSKNGVSIGVVPYASQVNIPASLRAKYNATNISSWDFVANQGVPNINCIEIPTGTYTSTALSRTSAMPMAAVADITSSVPTGTDYLKPSDYLPSVAFGPRICTTKVDDTGTPVNEAEYNQVLLPTKDAAPVKARIAQLTAGGNTSIAIGMRWGTALIDQSATGIYTITDDDGKVRPFQNNDETVRKIIVLMTDGEHVANNYVYDAYKTGPSPIWLGSDGNFAINFSGATRGPFTGTLPLSNCSGWVLSNTRTFFVPSLKRSSVKQKKNSDPEGQGTGTATTAACDPQAWIAPLANGNVTWQKRDANNNLVVDAQGKPVMITTQRLDWSEVWRYMRMNYLIYQVYNRANISSGVSVSTLQNTFRGTYLAVSTMNTLLQQNCTAGKTAGFEIYGIAFAAPANGKSQIQNCANPDQDGVKYFFDATNSADLVAAFNTIASDITDLRLTQ